MTNARSPVMYGEEALRRMGLSRISSTEWIGACPVCRAVAVFYIGEVVENGSTVLRCPDSCPSRAGQQ